MKSRGPIAPNLTAIKIYTQIGYSRLKRSIPAAKLRDLTCFLGSSCSCSGWSSGFLSMLYATQYWNMLAIHIPKATYATPSRSHCAPSCAAKGVSAPQIELTRTRGRFPTFPAAGKSVMATNSILFVGKEDGSVEGLTESDTADEMLPEPVVDAQDTAENPADCQTQTDAAGGKRKSF